MSKEICISTTPHETRLAIIEDEQLTEVYYERENEYTLAGSIYKGRVTRVLPGMQSAFVDVGLERDAFLYVTDFLEEQEDAAEFERVPGNGREEREQPTGSPDARVSSPANGAERNAAPSGEEFVEGTRRWRSRRGRRSRGGRGQTAPGQLPVAENLSAEEAKPSPDEDREIVAQPLETPFCLPGESLSKYGQTPAEDLSHGSGVREQNSLTNFAAPKPSTLVETPLQWDGGDVLPGESLSRYRRSAAEDASDSAGPAEAEKLQFSPLAGVEASSNDDPATSAAGRVLAPNTPQSSEAPDESAGSSGIAEEAVHAGEPSAEFEPQVASAYYRVDPSALSEFRVATPSTLEREEPAEDSFPAVPEIERHFGRSIEEHSRAAEEEAQAVPPETDDIQNEDRQSEDESAEEDFEVLMHELHTASSTAGLVEEEQVSEEEEYDFTDLYHQANDHDQLDGRDLEEIEEETLDRESVSGAEIEDLVRDTHIEQRVSSDAAGLAVDEAAEEGEENFEEEETPSADSETESEKSPAAPGRRERQDQRRGGRGNRHSGRRFNGRRQSAQTTSLPAISELLKQGQEILVQIAKEPIAKKGARITSHIALPGRFLVFMPTVNHVGVSRKISSDEERQRLKRILLSEKGAGGGFIIRTAADGASEEELRADIRFLISLWTEIKQRADAAKAPALIYHDLNLVQRILRDQVSESFSSIWVDSESEYERIVRFLNRFQPSLVRRVKLYTKETPLFEQFGVQEEIGKALKSKVWLKSGGSIVINQTEALVAIDINTGKYVGKTARLEDTILKTNLDAIPEIVRQIRLRDLGGIIVIDFIDMDERKNRHKVMQALEEELKSDRAPSKVLQFNDFGLVAITRKRVKQSLERTLCVQCATCTGTGMVKSPTTVCNEIYVELRKMQRHLERQDVLLRAHPEVVKTLKGNNARWLNELEEMSGKTIIVKSDPALPPEEFDIH